jgi:hypothetical protein
MSNTLQARIAGPEDFPRLIAMVRDFYVEDEILYQSGLVEPGLRSLLENASHGAVLLLSSEDVAEAGYITLGWCFSVEQGAVSCCSTSCISPRPCVAVAGADRRWRWHATGPQARARPLSGWK